LIMEEAKIIHCNGGITHIYNLLAFVPHDACHARKYASTSIYKTPLHAKQLERSPHFN